MNVIVIYAINTYNNNSGDTDAEAWYYYDHLNRYTGCKMGNWWWSKVEYHDNGIASRYEDSSGHIITYDTSGKPLERISP